MTMKINSLAKRLKTVTLFGDGPWNKHCKYKNNREPHQYEPKTKRFLRDPNAIKGSGGSRNKNFLVPSCKKPEFMLRQVCQPDD